MRQLDTRVYKHCRFKKDALALGKELRAHGKWAYLWKCDDKLAPESIRAPEGTKGWFVCLDSREMPKLELIRA